jgi:hypothetical protein
MLIFETLLYAFADTGAKISCNTVMFTGVKATNLIAREALGFRNRA